MSSRMGFPRGWLLLAIAIGWAGAAFAQNKLDLGKREFDSTDELRQQRAFAQLRESKADEETELWLRRLRDEAYVEYKL